MAEGEHVEEKAQGKPRQSIKVTDRRHFTADGDRRDELPDEPDDRSAARPVDKERPADAGFERRPLDEPSGVDFTMLINAFAQPALIFLGEIPHPANGQPTVDLEQARIQIDMLDLMRLRCRGNLSPQEESLLEKILYQLRMLYVTRSSSRPA